MVQFFWTTMYLLYVNQSVRLTQHYSSVIGWAELWLWCCPMPR